MDGANNNYTIALDGVSIVKADGSSAAFADLAIDDYVKLTFKGLAVTKAELITPIRGKVTAVNASSTSLTVQDFTGKSQLLTQAATIV